MPVDEEEVGDDDAVGSLRLYRNLIIFSHYKVSEGKVFISKLILSSDYWIMDILKDIWKVRR